MHRDWFDRPVLEVARDLLGATVTVVRPDGEVTVRLTEVEAYGGPEDPASHAFRGRTARNDSMFGPGGRLYVYRHLGLHHCANVVTGPPGTPAAVLLRSGEVVAGAGLAAARRSVAGVVRRPVDLARGPGRLAVALGLTLADDGLDLLGPGAHVVLGPSADEVLAGPRVGVAPAGADLAWRLWLPGSAVSTWRPGSGGRRAADR